ncbi:unnamed protein product [Rotaria sp. Silwood1]|nr:unnamed protein product [Rotaria sp. Silwood1]
MLLNLNFPITTILFCSIVWSSTGSIPKCGSNTNCCKTVVELINAGFSNNQINIMTAIAYYESTWGTRMGPNNNQDNSTDNGLFQINSYLWCSSSGQQNDCCCPGTSPKCRRNSTLRTCKCGCDFSCSEALTNNILNTKCAATILTKQGYTAWAGYNSHAAECNAYDTFNGECSSGSCCSDIYPGSVCCPVSDPSKQGCCPSTHTVCCPAPFQNDCCSSQYPVCCGYGCCPIGTYCCGNNQCCRQISSNGKALNQVVTQATLNAKHLS